MKLVLYFLLFGIFVVGKVHAKTTICTLQMQVVSKKVGWDDVGGVATYVDHLDKTFKGKLRATAKEISEGRVNLYFEFKPDYFGLSAAEFIVFPVGGEKIKVIGVGYSMVGGQRQLRSSLANESAHCVEI